MPVLNLNGTRSRENPAFSAALGYPLTHAITRIISVVDRIGRVK